MKPHRHSREPWLTVRNNHINVVMPLSGKRSLRVIWSKSEGVDVAYCMGTDSDRGNTNARRLVACVNFCSGIPTEELEHSYLTLTEEERLERIREVEFERTGADRHEPGGPDSEVAQ